jgi:hypothetical protein
VGLGRVRAQREDGCQATLGMQVVHPAHYPGSFAAPLTASNGTQVRTKLAQLRSSDCALPPTGRRLERSRHNLRWCPLVSRPLG